MIEGGYIFNGGALMEPRLNYQEHGKDGLRLMLQMEAYLNHHGGLEAPLV
jgi:hypothetical protein